MSLLLVLVVGCGGGAPAAAPGEQVTQGGLYRVRVTTEPTPVPLSQLFTAVVEVRDAKTGAPVEQASVGVDATMPQHGHGMTTAPVPDDGVCADGVCRHPGGIYRTEGMKFHMPGDWTVHVEVNGPAGPDRLDLVWTQ